MRQYRWILAGLLFCFALLFAGLMPQRTFAQPPAPRTALISLRLPNGQGVQGATARIYSFDTIMLESSYENAEVATCVTDTVGLCSVTLPPQQYVVLWEGMYDEKAIQPAETQGQYLGHQSQVRGIGVVMNGDVAIENEWFFSLVLREDNLWYVYVDTAMLADEPFQTLPTPFIPENRDDPPDPMKPTPIVTLTPVPPVATTTPLPTVTTSPTMTVPVTPTPIIGIVITVAPPSDETGGTSNGGGDSTTADTPETPLPPARPSGFAQFMLALVGLTLIVLVIYVRLAKRSAPSQKRPVAPAEDETASSATV